MAEHDLKTWPEYWVAVEAGAKTFEVRRNDRDFQPGDTVLLREWDPDSAQYTGRETRQRVTYVLRDAERFGVMAGFVVLGMTANDGLINMHDARGGYRDDAIQTAGHVWQEELDDERPKGGASVGCAASAGAQVAHEQATVRAEDSVTRIGVIPPQEWCRHTKATTDHEGPHLCGLRQGHEDEHNCPCGEDWTDA